MSERSAPSGPDAAEPSGAAERTARVALAMPARRSSWARVQLNTRVRVEVERLLQRFVDDHQTTLQSSVDLALTEFLAARGYPLVSAEDHSQS